MVIDGDNGQPGAREAQPSIASKNGISAISSSANHVNGVGFAFFSDAAHVDIDEDAYFHASHSISSSPSLSSQSRSSPTDIYEFPAANSPQNHYGAKKFRAKTFRVAR